MCNYKATDIYLSVAFFIPLNLKIKKQTADKFLSFVFLAERTLHKRDYLLFFLLLLLGAELLAGAAFGASSAAGVSSS